MAIADRCHEWGMRYEACVDRLKPYVAHRWGLVAILALITIQSVARGRSYAVFYVGATFIIANITLYMSPKWDPVAWGDDVFPLIDRENFRPFVRRVPEFRLWRRTFVAVVLMDLAVIMDLVEIPVNGVFLVMYLCAFTAVQWYKPMMELWRRGKARRDGM